MSEKIPVGISSCLLGEKVRFDGGHKLDNYITGSLSRYFEFRPFCPEMAIGLGVPRETIRLVRKDEEVRVVGVKNPSLDVTEKLEETANQRVHEHASLCGYILKKDSPSCGMERVKQYNGDRFVREGVGRFARQMMENHPCLPVEEEGRLGDPGLRENFVQRVFIMHRWKQLEHAGITKKSLLDFHARHKLVYLSHDQKAYRELGPMLSDLGGVNIGEVAGDYIARVMTLLKKVARTGDHVNVLQHIQGYLRDSLDSDDKTELHGVIQQYAAGEVPLVVPVTLLKHFFRKNPDEYILNSYYMNPHPAELGLFNKL